MKTEHELLNKRFAYVYKGGGHPIYNPDQLLPAKPMTWDN